MELNCKRPSAVVQIQPHIDDQCDFGWHSRILVWLLSFYGIRISADDHKGRSYVLHRLVMVTFFTFQLINVYFNGQTICGALVNGESELIYIVIPATISTLRPIVSIITLLIRERHLAKLFIEITTELTETYKLTREEIKKLTKPLEWLSVVVFVILMLSGNISRCVFTFVTERDLMHEKMNNITGHDIPDYVMVLSELVSTHGYLLELISAVVFSVYCALLRPMFSHSLFELSQVDAESVSIVRNRFRIGCEKVRAVNGRFSVYLFLSLAIQIFTMCFWTRSMAIEYDWIDINYHLWVLHFIVISLLSFLIQCYAAVSINHQVNSAVQFVSNEVSFNATYKEIKLDEILLLQNLQSNPPQITAWNAFAVTKAFIITLCGTVLTYTVALYGMA